MDQVHALVAKQTMRYVSLGKFKILYYQQSAVILTVPSERKRSQDKIYPKGYVEMLEQQQTQLVAGLKEMYHRLQKASAWEGPSLDETSGQPLTHDILSALDLLESKHDDSGETETFEENCDKLQSRMISEGAGFTHRRGSISSVSDHSHHERPRTASTHHETPVQPKMSVFKDSFHFPSATSSPRTQSPGPRSKPFTQQHALQPSIRPSPLQSPAFQNDPQLYSPDWSQALEDNSDPGQAYRAKLAMQQADYDSFNSWDGSQTQMDSYNQYAWSNQMGNGNMFGSSSDINEMVQFDGGYDIDFTRYVQQPEVIEIMS